MPTIDQYAALGDQEFDEQQTAGNTAMKRRGPSVPVQHAINQGLVAGRVLHQGAGRPDNPDRALLDSLGHAVHYDPNHSPETKDHLHRADFDTVVTPYVVNVLPPQHRQSVYQDAARSVKPDGRVVIAARSHRSVKPGPGWVEHQDGYWVPNKGTWNFQRGYTPEELRDEARQHFEHVEIVPGAKEPMVVARRPRPVVQSSPAPEARYTWYCDFLSRAGITPRPFDEWQAMQPERYAEPASQQPAAHEMTSEQAIAAGIPYHDWSHRVQDAFVNERIPEDHPAWASLKSARPDHFGGIPWVGRRVAVHAPHGRFFGTVKSAIPRGVVLEHFDGSLSKQSHDTLEDLQQWADDRTKRGRPIPQDVQERLGTPPSEPTRYAAPRGWLGVDLDGCLARYDDWQSWDHIGEPVPEMVGRVKQWLAEGRDVRIFTARVYGPDAERHRRAIEQWCRQYIGRVLPITATKDPGMYEFWDDRAIQVLRNTGRPVGRYSMTAQEIDEAVKDWQPPTEAQIDAGNYAKPTISWKGLTIKIENPRGTKRKPEWPELTCHYGYISRM